MRNRSHEWRRFTHLLNCPLKPTFSRTEVGMPCPPMLRDGAKERLPVEVFPAVMALLRVHARPLVVCGQGGAGFTGHLSTHSYRW